jgi:predicted nucleotidyltransferase
MRPAYRFGTQSSGVIRSLETGSRVYGKPRDGSDWDVVLLCTADGRDRIKLELGCEQGDYDDTSARDGDVNYILTISKKRFEAWVRGTERCLEEAPVTRRRAVEIHSEERWKSEAFG